MKSQKAKEFIDGLMDHLTVEMSDHAKWQLRTAMTHAAELAEQEAEERVRLKAIKAFCTANCPKGCSFGAHASIGCGAMGRFIQKLNDNEND